MADTVKKAGESTDPPVVHPTGAEPGTPVTPTASSAEPAEKADYMAVLEASSAWVAQTAGHTMTVKGNEILGPEEGLDRARSQRLFLLTRNVLEGAGFIVDPDSGYDPRIVVRVLEA